VKGIKAQAFNVRESFKPDSLTRESQQIYLVDNSLNGRDFVLKRYNIKNDTTLLRANEDFIAPVTKDKIVYRPDCDIKVSRSGFGRSGDSRSNKCVDEAVILV